MNMTQRIACKGLIVNPHNEILLLRKSHDDTRHAGNSGLYNLPGGKIDAGETLAEGLRREVYEETGLSIGTVPPVLLFVGEWRPVIGSSRLQIIGLFFICIDWTGALRLNDEHDKHVWVSASELSSFSILKPEDEALRLGFEHITSK